MGVETPWAKTDQEILRFFNVKSDVGLTKEQVCKILEFFFNIFEIGTF
jgi:hypothetical protein